MRLRIKLQHHNRFVRRGVRSAVIALCLMAVAASAIPLPTVRSVGQIEWGVPAAHAQAATSTPDPTGLNPSTDPVCSTSDVALCISDLVYFVAVAIPSWFLGIAAMFLGTLVKFSLESSTYALDWVSVGWTLMRDIANMSFIFILVYLGLTIMIKADTASTTATLGFVIVAALIINFSFFLTRTVIDVGNIVAVEIYNVIPVGQVSTGGGQASQNLLQQVGAKDLSSPIMGAIDIQGLFKTQSFQTWYQAQQGIKGFMTLLITLSCLYIGVGVIIVTLAFGFFTAGALFLYRVISLWFAIILSPAAVVAWAVPQFRKYYQKWQDLLIYNTLYPISFLLVFLFIALFMNELSAGAAGALLGNTFQNLAATGAGANGFLYGLASQIAIIAIELGFVILMLRFGLQFSEKFSNSGAQSAHRFANWTSQQFGGALGFTGGAAAGTLAGGVRSIVGRDRISRMQTEAGRLERQGGTMNRLNARLLRWSASGGDLRQTPLARNVEGNYDRLGRAGGGELPVDFGKAWNDKLKPNPPKKLPWKTPHIEEKGIWKKPQVTEEEPVALNRPIANDNNPAHLPAPISANANQPQVHEGEIIPPISGRPIPQLTQKPTIDLQANSQNISSDISSGLQTISKQVAETKQAVEKHNLWSIKQNLKEGRARNGIEDVLKRVDTQFPKLRTEMLAKDIPGRAEPPPLRTDAAPVSEPGRTEPPPLETDREEHTSAMGEKRDTM